MPLNFVAKAAITIGMAAANMALTMTRKIEGPRLDNLKFTAGDYGAPLYMVWGTRRLEVPIFWAEDLKEVQRRRKTKGGKYNEFTYYGTWAVAVAGHEIALIRRIWFDTHLVYDVSGAGPVTPFDFGGSGNITDFIAIYLGTEDQEPDPRMHATVEGLFGEGSCPAYRDTAYIVFKDIPLEKLGNRIPQVSVEVVTAGEPAFPYETLDIGSTYPIFSYDKSTLALVSFGGDISIVDNAAIQEMLAWDVGVGLNPQASSYAYLADGSIIAGQGVNSIFELGLGGGATFITSPNQDGTVTSVVDGYGIEWWVAPRAGDTEVVNGSAVDTPAMWGRNSDHSKVFLDAYGEAWTVGQNGSTEVVFYRLSPGDLGTGPRLVTVEGLPSYGNTHVIAFHYTDAEHDQFVLFRDNEIYLIDKLDGSIIDSMTADFDSEEQMAGVRSIIPGAATFWDGFTEYSSRDFSVVREMDYADWVGGGTHTLPVIYDPINHALVVATATYTRWCFLDRITPGAVTLAEIEGDVADWVGIEDYDFSVHTQEVQGWSATQGQASNMIEPLHAVYDCTIRPHDFGIQGINFTGVEAGTLLTENFVAGDPRYAVKVRQAAELPRAVIVNFADVDGEQQPNNVRSDRPLDAMGGKGEQSIDLTTWASDVDEARAYADRYFRRIWNERREVSLSLTAQQLALEPGDLRTLDLDGDADTYRLISLTIRANDVLSTEWRYDHPSLAVTDSAKGANFDGRTPSVIAVPLLSRGLILDTPYITDADDQNPPIIYAFATPYATGTWPGANIFQGIDGEYTEQIATVTTSQKATWGYVTEELPYANPNLWDRGNEITVTLTTGTLTGCTEADIDANPLRNLAAIGEQGRWEFVNFTTAELTDTLTYTLSGFKRGRRGTEWAAELHAANDTFLLMDVAQDVAMELSEVGTNLTFKAITVGRTTGFPINLTPYTGASLKPYAPCHLEAVKEDNGDWTLTWVRRTRVGGAWTSGTPIPLSEVTEEYEVEILDGDTVVRTFAGLTDPTVTYTAEQQDTDFGSPPPDTLEWRVYQISDAVDRGFMAEATV